MSHYISSPDCLKLTIFLSSAFQLLAFQSLCLHIMQVVKESNFQFLPARFISNFYLWIKIWFWKCQLRIWVGHTKLCPSMCPSTRNMTPLVKCEYFYSFLGLRPFIQTGLKKTCPCQTYPRLGLTWRIQTWILINSIQMCATKTHMSHSSRLEQGLQCPIWFQKLNVM